MPPFAMGTDENSCPMRTTSSPIIPRSADDNRSLWYAARRIRPLITTALQVG